MRKITFFLLILSLCNGHYLQGQSDFFQDIPCYKKVVQDFYAHYEPTHEQKIGFIKKSGGWYIGSYDDSGHIHRDIYRKVHEPVYETLNFKKRTEALTREQVMNLPEYGEKMEMQFNFERCAFYGYKQWCWDVIKEYGKKNTLSDRELESLGRANANYANGFLPFFQYDNKANEGSPYRKEMKASEKVPEIRIDSFLHYEDKAIEKYEQLVLKNPGYNTIVGNFTNKLCNEYMDVYLKLRYLGQHDKAIKYLNQCNYNPNILTTAYNYFNGLPKNAILVTNGDNDTYPLWYLQLAENFRRDVAVLNTALLGIPHFNAMIADSSADFQTVLLDSLFVKIPFSYYWKKDEKAIVNLRDSIPLEDIIRHVRFREDSLPVFKPGRYYFRCSDTNIVFEKNEDYCLPNDIVLLRIISQNISTREIFFTARDIISEELAKNTSQKGRLWQFNCHNKSIPYADKQYALNYFRNGFKPFSFTTAFDIDKERTINITYYGCITLINQTIQLVYQDDPKDMATLIELAVMPKNIWYDKKWHYDESLFDLLKTFYKSGLFSEARELRAFLEKEVMKKLPDYVKYEDAWYVDDYSRLNYFEYYVQDVIDNTDFTKYPMEKTALDALLEKIKGFQK